MSVEKSESDRVLSMANTIKGLFPSNEIAQLIRLISAAPSTGEMNQEQFERLMKDLEPKTNRPGYSAKSIEAARLILVHGATPPEAAADTGLSQSAVRALMKRIRRRMVSIPDGWKQVTCWFPDGVAEQIKGISDALIAAEESGTPVPVKILTLTLPSA